MKVRSTGVSAAISGFLLQKGPSAAIGVLAAVMTVVGIDHWRARASGSTAAHQAETTVGDSRDAPQRRERETRTVVVDQNATDRISELERRMREVEAAKAGASDAGAAPDEPRLDPEEVRRRRDEQYARMEEAHARDSVDPTWAPGARKGLSKGLTQLGETIGFTLGATECKTTSCRATVTWGNYSAARTTGAQLVEHLFGGLNCRQNIRLPEPTDPDAPYTTSLYLDCTDLRAGAVDELRVD